MPGADPDDRMFLVFRLDGEAFAISVAGVEEILDPQTPTPVPNAGNFSPGLINVRGVVVPVVDVRNRLEMSQAKQLPTSRMIVFDHVHDGQAQRLAFMTDAVEEVFDCDPSDAEPIPELGAIWPQQYLRGAIRRGEELVILLEAETLFNPAAENAAA